MFHFESIWSGWSLPTGFSFYTSRQSHFVCDQGTTGFWSTAGEQHVDGNPTWSPDVLSWFLIEHIKITRGYFKRLTFSFHMNPERWVEADTEQWLGLASWSVATPTLRSKYFKRYGHPRLILPVLSMADKYSSNVLNPSHAPQKFLLFEVNFKYRHIAN